MKLGRQKEHLNYVAKMFLGKFFRRFKQMEVDSHVKLSNPCGKSAQGIVQPVQEDPAFTFLITLYYEVTF